MAQLIEEASRSGTIAEAGAQDESYTTVHDKATGDTISTGGIDVGQEGGIIAGSEWYWVIRGALEFDTSSLPDNATISAAVLALYIGTPITPDSAYDIVVVDGANMDNPYAGGDYGDLLSETTSLGSIAQSSLTADAYNDITLNASGIALVSKTGLTKLALRSNLDINSTSPKINGGYYTDWDSFQGYADANPPKLTITYTTPAGVFSRAFIIG